MEIRKAQQEEFAQIVAFYQQRISNYSIGKDDLIFLAIQCGTIHGVVRLVEEEGVLVLRGMEVAAGSQRTGIGTALLHRVVLEIGIRECYCIPFSHLTNFYGQAGFQELYAEQAPNFLKQRLKRYVGESHRCTIMCRPGAVQINDQF